MSVSGREMPSTYIDFTFYTLQSDIYAFRSGSFLVVDHVFAIGAYIRSTRLSSQRKPTESESMMGSEDPVLPNTGIAAYPWGEIVDVCAGHEGFTRLQLEFNDRGDLVQLVEVHRAVLGKLGDRLGLYYLSGYRKIAVDFETLADLGGMRFPSSPQRRHAYWSLYRCMGSWLHR